MCVCVHPLLIDHWFLYLQYFLDVVFTVRSCSTNVAIYWTTTIKTIVLTLATSQDGIQRWHPAGSAPVFLEGCFYPSLTAGNHLLSCTWTVPLPTGWWRRRLTCIPEVNPMKHFWEIVYHPLWKTIASCQCGQWRFLSTWPGVCAHHRAGRTGRKGVGRGVGSSVEIGPFRMEERRPLLGHVWICFSWSLKQTWIFWIILPIHRYGENVKSI